jgi:hypothetical protein
MFGINIKFIDKSLRYDTPYFRSKTTMKRSSTQSNEVMRSVCVAYSPATEVVLLFKLGGNEVFIRDTILTRMTTSYFRRIV